MASYPQLAALLGCFFAELATATSRGALLKALAHGSAVRLPFSGMMNGVAAASQRRLTVVYIYANIPIVSSASRSHSATLIRSYPATWQAIAVGSVVLAHLAH